VIEQLINLSDSNCNNFLGRLFAKETGTSFARTLVNVVSSATAAVTGFVSVPAATGMNASNLAAGGGLDAINTNIYYSKTAPDIAKSILIKRKEIRDAIAARELGKTAAQSADESAKNARANAKAAAASCEDRKKESKDAAKKPATVGAAIDQAANACKAAEEADSAAKDAADAASKADSAQSLKPLEGPYMISDAISDVMEYDSYCSMLGGLMSLSSAVNAQAAATTPASEAQKQAGSAQSSANKAAVKAAEAKGHK
jgi:hypothetical protein